MKREITFRGKTIGGSWVYGNYAHIKKDFSTVRKGHYISNSIGSPFAFLVRPETVGQYTGLKDKNGVKIFEGDIIESPSFIDTFSWVDGGYTFDKDISDSVMTAHYPYEVIGNIHDNPELLNKNV